MEEQVYHANSGASSKSKFTAKVFGFMFFGLLITAIVAVLTSFLVIKFNPEDIAAHRFPVGLAIADIVGAIGFIIAMIFTQVKSAKQDTHGALAFGLVSTICMGVMVSATTVFIEWWIIGTAFAVTSLMFAVMFLIGYFAKKDLSILALIGFGLLAGVSIIGLMSLLFAIIIPNAYAIWGTSILMNSILTVYVLLISVVDMQRIRKLAEAGYTSNSMALSMATSLYVDFIYIFLRVVIIIANARR